MCLHTFTSLFEIPVRHQLNRIIIYFPFLIKILLLSSILKGSVQVAENLSKEKGQLDAMIKNL